MGSHSLATCCKRAGIIFNVFFEYILRRCTVLFIRLYSGSRMCCLSISFAHRIKLIELNYRCYLVSLMDVFGRGRVAVTLCLELSFLHLLE